MFEEELADGMAYDDALVSPLSISGLFVIGSVCGRYRILTHWRHIKETGMVVFEGLSRNMEGASHHSEILQPPYTEYETTITKHSRVAKQFIKDSTNAVAESIIDLGCVAKATSYLEDFSSLTDLFARALASERRYGPEWFISQSGRFWAKHSPGFCTTRMIPEARLADELYSLVDEARSSLTLCGPYITITRLSDRIEAASKRGVSVRVISNESSYSTALMKRWKSAFPGIEVYQNRRLHAKMCICDIQSVIFGSSNPSRTGLGETPLPSLGFQIEANWFTQEQPVVRDAIRFCNDVLAEKDTWHMTT